MMAIEIQCPNGHKLTCPDHITGTHVKCPQCGSLAEIPVPAPSQAGPAQHPSTPHAHDSSSSHIDLEQPVDPDESVTQKQKRPPFAANQISFLCPNGHKLNAPVNLQGRVGQCPHCHAKFRIPTVSSGATGPEPDPSPSTPNAPQESAPTQAISPAPNAPAPTEPPQSVPEPSQPVMERLATTESETAGPVAPHIAEIDPDEIREIAPSALATPSRTTPAEDPAAPTPAGTHSLISIFDRLWEERAHDALVEIHLADGVVVAPDWWAKNASNAGFGLFALENRDGSYQMEAIAWDSVQRVIVRNITELPGGLFE